MFELVNIISIDALVETFFSLVGSQLGCPLLVNALATKEAKSKVKSIVTKFIEVARGNVDDTSLWSLYGFEYADEFISVYDSDSLGSQYDDIYQAAKVVFESYLSMLRENRTWFV